MTEEAHTTTITAPFLTSQLDAKNASNHHVRLITETTTHAEKQMVNWIDWYMSNIIKSGSDDYQLGLVRQHIVEINKSNSWFRDALSTEITNRESIKKALRHALYNMSRDQQETMTKPTYEEALELCE